MINRVIENKVTLHIGIKMNIKYTCFLLTALLLLSGCVTGTRSIELETPNYESEITASGDIVIKDILDNRQFEAKPASPSTPSIKNNLESASAEKLSTMIGRQRNGYGRAMGDVALIEGKNVEGEMRALLTEGLESRGYTVTENANTSTALSVEIEKFWAWFTPGFWAVSFESALESNLKFNKADGSQANIKVSGYGLNKGQVASDANWKLAYKRAFENFLENLDKALDKEGL